MSHRGHARLDRGQQLAGPLPRIPLPLVQRGACVGHPQRDWWSSAVHAERRQAAAVCQTRCPVLGLCRAWAAALPPAARQGVVLGGRHTPLLNSRNQRAS